jgi:hypothetical protein
MTKRVAISVIREIASALDRLARPYLTAIVTTVFNGMCAWGVIAGKLSFKDYIMAIGPANAMIIGFWFGERTAMKRAGQLPVEGQQ